MSNGESASISKLFKASLKYSPHVQSTVEKDMSNGMKEASVS
jgi:hypothetical protein